jgi:hypothetical protein
MVPKIGLEPIRLAPPPPQDGVSTNFTTSAFCFNFFYITYSVLLILRYSQCCLAMRAQGYHYWAPTVIRFAFDCAQRGWRYNLIPDWSQKIK